MSLVPRAEIAALCEAIHGAVNASELESLGIDPGTIVDFSVNVNPFGPSPKAVAALSQVPLDRYPDREATQLRRVLAERLAIPSEQLLTGNGSGELLQWIALAYVHPGDSVLIIGPTYAEYARASFLMGARCSYCNASVETGFAVPIDAIENMLHGLRPRVLFICNPNNPTGQFLAPDILGAWAEEFAQTLFVVDEAYIDFVPEAPSLAGAVRHNVVVLRSLTKAYGLAGLRLGYAIAAADVIRELRRVRTPWSVNAAAQAAGAAAVQDQEHQQRTLAQLREAKQSLIERLRSLGLDPLSSLCPFFLVPVVDSARARSTLIRSGVLVRDCSSFGLPGFLRIGTRSPADNARLIEAMAAMRSAAAGPLSANLPGDE